MYNDGNAGADMRFNKTYLRPIMTAVLFSIALLVLQWSVGRFFSDDWLPWTEVRISAPQAMEIAESQCFARAYHPPRKPWRARLRDGRWSVWTATYDHIWKWTLTSGYWPDVIIDANSGRVLSCSRAQY